MHVGVANGAPDLEVVTGADGERGVKQQVFPAAHPSKREDVRLLAHWLTETLQHLDGSLPYVRTLTTPATVDFRESSVWAVFALCTLATLRHSVCALSRDCKETTSKPDSSSRHRILLDRFPVFARALVIQFCCDMPKPENSVCPLYRVRLQSVRRQ